MAELMQELPRQTPITAVEWDSFPVDLLSVFEENFSNAKNFSVRVKYHFTMPAKDFFLYLGPYFEKVGEDEEYEETFYDSNFFVRNTWIKAVKTKLNPLALVFKYVKQVGKQIIEYNFNFPGPKSKTLDWLNMLGVYELKVKRRNYKCKLNNTYLTYDLVQFKDQEKMYSVFSIFGELSPTASYHTKQEQYVIAQKAKPCRSKIIELLYQSKRDLYNTLVENKIVPDIKCEEQHDNNIFEREEKAKLLIEFLDDKNSEDASKFTETQLQGFYFLALTTDFTLEDCDSDEEMDWL